MMEKEATDAISRSARRSREGGIDATTTEDGECFPFMNQLVLRERRLTVRPLVAALFFLVSGGPYGLEELVQKCGAWGAALVIVVTPVLWSLPTALLVGELASALPEEGGFYAWVRRALGPFWGFQEAWLSLAASMFDMAIYPTLFVTYAGQLVPAIAHPPWSLVVSVLFIVCGGLWNLRGAASVAWSAVVESLIVIVPFALLAGLSVSTVAGPGDLPRPMDPLGGILIAMWNFMGWDNASTFAGEVHEPQRTYPRAVILAVIAVTAVYLVPVLAVAVGGIDTSGWSTGSWVTLGRERGGAALAVVLIAGGALSSFSMFNTLTLSYSRLPVAMAGDGLLPRVFLRTTKNTHAPWIAILACAALWTLSLGFSFERLVMLDILLYGLSLLLEFVALIVLRIREPALPRPFRIPGGLVACIALSLPPAALIAVSVVRNRSERLDSGLSALVLGTIVVALGPLAYLLSRSAHWKPG
jgi:amino acid transporter